MSAGLRAHLADYLAIRRAMGFSLARDEKLLLQFIGHLETCGNAEMTIEHAVSWVLLPPAAGGKWISMRMGVVRGFAGYLHSLDQSVPVPPAGLLPAPAARAVPFLYSDQDIDALVAQCARLRWPIGRLACPVLIRLLAATGMRIGETLALDDTDLSGDGVIMVRHAKNGKVRLVALHPTAHAALRDYQRERDLLFPQPGTPALFLNSAGKRMEYVNFSWIFAKLARRAGFAPRPGNCRPRPHDLRHTFAVRTLTGWYADGGDVASRLPLLSTYLGHSEPKNTYWYMHAAPELLALAAERLEISLRRNP